MDFINNSIAKTCLASAIAVALMTGCGSGGKSKGHTQAPADTSITVAGGAMKGIIKNGVVTLYAVTNGARGTVLANGRTGNDGRYSLQVEGYSGPVIVEITSDGSSLMACDIPAGCDGDGGTVGFGADYPLATGFALKAIVPEATSGQSVQANVSALTDMAAALAEKQGISSATARSANSQVANLFELPAGANIVELPIVDITDPSALTNTSSAALKAAVVSAGILAAAVEDGHSVEAGASSFSSAFAAKDGQVIQNEDNDTATTLAEVLANTSALINSNELSAVPSLQQIGTDVAVQQAVAEAAEPGATTNVQPGEATVSDGIEKAKSLVQDLRDLSTAASLDNIKQGGTAFADELKTARDLISNDTNLAVSGLAMVAKAIGEAIQADESEYVNGIFIASNGVEVLKCSACRDGEDGYDSVGNVHVEDSNGVSHELTVDLRVVGTLSIVDDRTVTSENGTTTGHRTKTITTANLEVFDRGSSTVNGGNSLIYIGAGSRIEVEGYAEEWNYSETSSSTEESFFWSEEGDNSIEVSNVLLDLKDVVVEQQGVAEPVSFMGALSVSLEDFSETLSEGSMHGESGCQGYGYCAESGDTNGGASTITFSKLSIVLNGTFARGDENFGATFALNANNPYGYEQVSSWSDSWGWSADTGWYGEYDSDSSEETADQFVQLNFSLNLQTSLAGISNEVSVRLSGDRTALNTGAANLGLRYNGKAIDAVLNVSETGNKTAAALTITNNQGATLLLNDSDIDDDSKVSSGVIRANGDQQATVTQENKVVVVRYKDGSFESIQ